MSRIKIAAGLLLLFALALLLSRIEERERIQFGGGPGGGTFIVFARGLAELIEQQQPDTQIEVQSSGGSVENLIDIEQGRLAMGLVYAGDAWLGRQGRLGGNYPKTERVQALARIYGSTAQLVVRQKSIIRSPLQLKNRRVAIGSAGSGAAHSAERFFRALGIWEEITPLYIGYRLGMEQLGRGWVEAVWQLVGAPSDSISQASRKLPLRLLDLHRAAQQSGFYQQYPFYTATSIAPHTYSNQQQKVATFQDATLWVAAPDLDREYVQRALATLFSAEGLQQMRQVHPVAVDLDAEKGLRGIKIPLHPGAERFWQERGLLP